MKQVILTCVGLALAASAFGQGTVRFSNVSADLAAPPDRLVRFGVGTTNPFGTNNAPLVNFGTASYRAQLYYGASTAAEASLVAVSTSPALFRSSTTTAEPGTWAPGNRTMNGFDIGATVNLQVRVWDSAFGSTWELFQANANNAAGYRGTSALFQYTVPTDPLAPLTAFTMTGFTAFSTSPGGIIPEPSTFALAGLGAGLLVFLRRRK
jgi:hypothetical protein